MAWHRPGGTGYGTRSAVGQETMVSRMALLALLLLRLDRGSGSPASQSAQGPGRLDEECSASAGLHIAARWDMALASYDPLARSIWLEFDIQHAVSRQLVPDTCLSAEALVLLDDAVVATTRDSEAGVLVPGVGLGRHWLRVVLRDAAGAQITEQIAEFTLPWHTHIRITEPPARHKFAPSPGRAHSPLRTCFRLVPAGNCSAMEDDKSCVLSAPVIHLYIYLSIYLSIFTYIHTYIYR